MREVLDLLAAAGLVLAAAVAASAGAPGGPLRMVLAALVVFVLPGYLLLEAALPSRQPGDMPRAMRFAAAVGLSPALVGLAALATALVPGGFKPVTILGAVTLLSIALAAVAVARRHRPAADRAGAASPSAAGPAGPRGA